MSNFRRPFSLISAALALALSLLLSPVASAQNAVTDPNYVLLSGDTLVISVLEEADLSINQLIDKDGRVRPALMEDVPVAGLTVRATEQLLEKLYVDQELLKRPQVRINVVNYAPRLITILGAVRSPGKVSFGQDSNSIDIVDAITKAGGFSAVARKDQVSVIRTGANGKEETFVVDVEALMSAKRPAGGPRDFPLIPGDRVVVRERVF